MFKKFAIATVLAALLLAAGHHLLRPDLDSGAASPVAVATIDQLEPVHGLQPLGEIVELWQRRVAAHPLDYLSRTQLGVALATEAKETADLDGYTRAEEVLREALAVNPAHEPAQLGLASTLLAQHEFAAALAEAESVLASIPGSSPALALIGDANLELGNYPEAATAYHHLAATERSAPAVSRLARLAYVEGDPVKAVALATEALDLSRRLALRPDASAFFWFQLGHYRFVVGDVDASIDAYEQALEIDPDNPGASESLAFALASRGDIEEAASAYAQLVDRSPAADIHGLYADVLRSLGRGEEARQQDALGHQLAAATVDRYPAERRHLIGFYLTRDPELAVELAVADAAIRSDVGAHDTLAWALHHSGRHNEAAIVIERALEVGTQDAELLYHAGAIAEANGNSDQAIDFLHAALTLNPRFHPTEADAARALLDEISAETVDDAGEGPNW